MSVNPKFESAISKLSSSLNSLGLKFAIIGGTAVVLRGYDRSTQDIDAVVIDADDILERLLETLEKNGLYPRIPDCLKFAIKNRIILLEAEDKTEIDLSMGMLQFEVDLVERATLETIFNLAGTPVVTAEDLVILKLIARRPRDLDDAKRLLEINKDVNLSTVEMILCEYSLILEEPPILANFHLIVDQLYRGTKTGD